MISVVRCKFTYMNTYSERLRSAMEEAGYGGPGGQTKLAKEIGARSQTINQALSGGSKELSATFHVRACMRLGVLPLWLAEGKGRRYEMDVVVVNADEAHKATIETQLGSNLVNLVTEPQRYLGLTATPAKQLSDAETRLIRALREQPQDVQDAVAHLVACVTRN